MILAMVAGVILFRSARVTAAPPPTGVIALETGVDPAPVLSEAARTGGATWRIEALPPPRPVPPMADPVAAVEQLYLEADFDRCLAAGLDPALGLEGLVSRGALIAAARASVLVAACAHATAETSRAEDLLRRALIMELDVGPALLLTRADFQAFVEQVRRSVATLPRHRIEVTSEPSGAVMMIDGRAARCGPNSCVTSSIAGEHVVVAQRFGRRTRVATIEAPREVHVVLALDPAPTSEARDQLAAVIHATTDRDPGILEVGTLAADVFGARVVVVLRRRGETTFATLFDRKVSRIVSSVEARGPTAAVVAAGHAIREWRAQTERTPLIRNWKFWAVVSLAVVGTAVGTYAIARPNTQDDLVFQ